MLTVKQINEVSFGKAGFSGYKPEDVDRFIDEVAATVRQLGEEKEAAERRVAELTARNSETQEKLAILAEKIEAYRRDEDDIKDAIISAQKISTAAIEEARAKADLMVNDAKCAATALLADAKRSAEKMLSDARYDAEHELARAQDQADALLAHATSEAERNAREYIRKSEEKKREMEEVQKQVTAFRGSLLEMYKKHLELINHIPVFHVRDKNQPVSPERTKENQEDTYQQENYEPHARSYMSEEQINEEALPLRREKRRIARDNEEIPAAQSRVNQPEALHEKHDFVSDATNILPEEDLSSEGIDASQYTNIPESLQEEKRANYTNLKFGRDVDITRT